MNERLSVLAAMMSALEFAATSDPNRQFLLDNGWVPLGRNCETGIEGWGKVIDGTAVTVDQPEALRMQRGWRDL